VSRHRVDPFLGVYLFVSPKGPFGPPQTLRRHQVFCRNINTILGAPK
jgi:hypothetical protein